MQKYDPQNRSSRGIMKVPFAFLFNCVLFDLVTRIIGVEIDIVYRNEARQRMYFRNYRLLCPITVRIANSYADERKLFLKFSNVRFLKTGFVQEIRQNHNHARPISYFQIQIVDSVSKSLKFHTIQPINVESESRNLNIDCSQVQNRLTIRINDLGVSNALNSAKNAAVLKQNRRGLYKKRNPTSKSRDSGSSGKNNPTSESQDFSSSRNNKPERVQDKRNNIKKLKRKRKPKIRKLIRKTKTPFKKIFLKIKPIVKKKS